MEHAGGRSFGKARWVVGHWDRLSFSFCYAVVHEEPLAGWRSLKWTGRNQQVKEGSVWALPVRHNVP